MTAVAAKPDLSNISAEAARQRAITLQETARRLHDEVTKLRCALSWMENYDPQLVASARFKFDLPA